MAGPVARTYKAGSIIYFEGDMGKEIYVLQKGRVILISTSLDQKSEIKEDVRKGEFFGVKSILGHHPREETAQVLTDTVVLVFRSSEFEALSLKNTRIVLQMLKVFSSQLRKVHNKVRELLGEMSNDETSIELVKVAEYYYKNNQLDEALHGYEAYLNNYPNGQLSDRAMRMCQNIKKGVAYPLDVVALENEIEQSQPQDSNLNYPRGGRSPADMVEDFSSLSVSESASDMSIEPNAGGDLGDSLDFDNGLDLDAGTDSGGSSETVSDLYYAGLNLLSQEDFDGAVSKFEAVLNVRNLATNETRLLEDSLMNLGNVYTKKGSLDKAIEKYLLFTKRHPNSEHFKAVLFSIGEVYIKKGDKQKAITTMNKVMSIPPKDKLTNQAEAKIMSLGS